MPEDMKFFKTKCKSYYALLGFTLLAMLMILASCSNDIDSKIERCYNENDTIIQMSDLYPQEWDTMFYIMGDPSPEEVERKLGYGYRYLTQDTGDKLLLINNQKGVVYYKEWEMIYDQKIVWPIFIFDEGTKVIAIPRDSAKFLIRKRDKDSFWVYWIGKDSYSASQIAVYPPMWCR